MFKQTQVPFLPDCSFKKPSKFSKSVNVVNDYADMVTT